MPLLSLCKQGLSEAAQAHDADTPCGGSSPPRTGRRRPGTPRRGLGLYGDSLHASVAWAWHLQQHRVHASYLSPCVHVTGGGRPGLRTHLASPRPAVCVTLGFAPEPQRLNTYPLEGAILGRGDLEEYNTITPLASGVLKAVHDTGLPRFAPRRYRDRTGMSPGAPIPEPNR